MGASPDIANKTAEPVSYIRTEKLVKSANDPTQNAETTQQFVSYIEAFKRINEKLKKINEFKRRADEAFKSNGTKPFDIFTVLNKLLPERLGINNDGDAYFVKQGDDIVLVINNIKVGTDFLKSDASMQDMLRKIDETITNNKTDVRIEELYSQYVENPQLYDRYIKLTREYSQKNLQHQNSLRNIQASYLSDRSIVSSILDIGNGISGIYKDSFNQQQKNARATYEEFLNKRESLVKEFEKYPMLQKVTSANQVQEAFETTLGMKFEKVSLGRAIIETDAAQFGYYLLVESDHKWDYAVAGALGGAEGLYDSTIGFALQVLKLFTNKKAQESFAKEVKKFWEYVKKNPSDKILSDAKKLIADEMERISQLPPEEQAHAIGVFFGNLMGTILLGKGVGAVKNSSIVRVKYAKGADAFAKMTEVKNIRNWEHLYKYIDSIDRIRFSKGMDKAGLKKMIDDVRFNSGKVDKLPKVAGIQEMVVDLIKNGNDIQKSTKLAAKATSLVEDTVTSSVQKIGSVGKKAINSSAGKMVGGATEALVSLPWKCIYFVGSRVGSITEKILEIEKIQKTFELAGKGYSKAKGVVDVADPGYVRRMILKNVNHIEQTVSTIKGDFKTLFEGIKNDPGLFSAVEQSWGVFYHELGYLTERLVKDPLLANVVERWYLYEGIKKSGKIALVKTAEWAKKANVNITLDQVSEKHWINRGVNKILLPKEKVAGGRIKFTEKVDIGGGKFEDRTGFKDLKGNVIVRAKYVGGTDYSKGYAIVNEENSYSILNTEGKSVFHINNTVPQIEILEGDTAKIIIERGSEKESLIFDLKESKTIVKTETKSNRFEEIGKKVGVPGDQIHPLEYEYASAFEKDGAWGIITRDDVVLEKKFTSKPQSHRQFFFGEENGAWSVYGKDGKPLSFIITSEPIKVKHGNLFIETDKGWKLINTEGKVIANVKSKPKRHIFEGEKKWELNDRILNLTADYSSLEEVTNGVILLGKDGKWRIMTHNEVIPRIVSTSKPREFGAGFLIEKEGKYKLVTGEGKIVEEVFTTKPVPRDSFFTVGNEGKLKVITEEGQQIAKNFRSIEKWEGGLVGIDSKGYVRTISQKGELSSPIGLPVKGELIRGKSYSNADIIERAFQTKAEPIGEYIAFPDASGKWRVVGKDLKGIEDSTLLFPTKPEAVGAFITFCDESGEWKLMKELGNINETKKIYSTKRPELLGDYGIKMTTVDGNFLVDKNFKVRGRLYEDIALKPDGSLQIKRFDGEVLSLNNKSFEMQPKTEVVPTESADIGFMYYAAIMTEEYASALKESAKAFQKDIDLRTFRIAGEDAGIINAVLEKTTLEDFMAGLRVDSKKLSPSFEKLLEDFSGIKDKKALEKHVSKTVQKGVDAYIENLNKRRVVLSERSLQRLNPLSETEIAYLKKTYKDRMTQEFMQEIEKRVANPNFSNSGHASYLGKFIEKGKMNPKLQSDLAGFEGHKEFHYK